MTVVRSAHELHGAVFETVAGRDFPTHYGRPERTHRAVRNGVGVLETAYGILAVEGGDRVEYVDNVVSNRVPDRDGAGCYAVLLDPQGGIRTDLYVYNAGERLLLFFPPGHAETIATEWREKVFIQDVSIDIVTTEFGVFGVHGPQAVEKLASVLNGAATPEEPLTFVRGTLGDTAVTAIRSDNLPGEEGFEVICRSSAASSVFDILLNQGLNAAPFGRETWRTLTLEAGTPLFETELHGQIPNVVGLRNAVDFEKGCFVGQEVVARVENRGRPSRRLVGLRPDEVPQRGAAVFDGDASVGEVTRAAVAPSLEGPASLAFVDFDIETRTVAIRIKGEDVPAQVVDLPFVEGSARSARLPTY